MLTQTLAFCLVANQAGKPLVNHSLSSRTGLTFDKTKRSRTVSPQITKVKIDQYLVELRVPPEGLFAGEEIDVEFRVTDTTLKDAIEAGFKGVGAISAKSVLTMPSMPGMPEARPKVHREGVPGDYGIELFFPHGGDYHIDLTLDIPKVGVKRVAFLVDVKDERPEGLAKPQPFKLVVLPHQVTPQAGKPTKLQMAVMDNKTKDVQKEFDIAHEQKFHLLICSKDLNWFVHEHPEMDARGIWTQTLTFPAGGDYWVYGDVAPAGQGSRVLISKVSVNGAKPTWNTKLVPSREGKDGELKGLLSTLQPIEIGKKVELQVKLFDTQTGRAVGDTVKWLGAAGHMMIFHRDGQTVVHSHPNEDEASEALVRKGIVRFSGRFPKPGTYKVYAQFDWRGKIRTLPFAIEVRS